MICSSNVFFINNPDMDLKKIILDPQHWPRVPVSPGKEKIAFICLPQSQNNYTKFMFISIKKKTLISTRKALWDVWNLAGTDYMFTLTVLIPPSITWPVTSVWWEPLPLAVMVGLLELSSEQGLVSTQNCCCMYRWLTWSVLIYYHHHQHQLPSTSSLRKSKLTLALGSHSACFWIIPLAAQSCFPSLNWASRVPFVCSSWEWSPLVRPLLTRISFLPFHHKNHLFWVDSSLIIPWASVETLGLWSQGPASPAWSPWWSPLRTSLPRLITLRIFWSEWTLSRWSPLALCSTVKSSNVGIVRYINVGTYLEKFWGIVAALF